MSSIHSFLLQAFDWVIRASIMASLLVILIVVVKILLKNKLQPRWHYIIWLPVVIRLLLPWSPESSISMYNLLPQQQYFSNDYRPIESAEISKQKDLLSDTNNQIDPSIGVKPAEQTSEAISTESTTKPVTLLQSVSGYFSELNMKEVLMYIWLIGAISFALVTIIANLNVTRRMKKQKHITNLEIIQALENCKQRMEIKRPVTLIATDIVPSPAVFGFVKPKILLSNSMIRKFQENQLKYIFFHELAHIQRRDVAMNWLIHMLMIIHWFNPIMWYACKRIREDQEVACDALALSQISNDQKTEYGHMIIHLLEHISKSRRLPGLVGFFGNKEQLKRRILMIKHFKENSYRLSALGLITVIAIGATSVFNPQSSYATIVEPQTLETKKEVKVDLNANEKLQLDKIYKYRPDLKSLTISITGSEYADKEVSYTKDGKEVAFVDFENSVLTSFYDRTINLLDIMPQPQKEEELIREMIGANFDQYKFDTNRPTEYYPVVNGIPTYDLIRVEFTKEGKLQSYWNTIGTVSPSEYSKPGEAMNIKEVEKGFGSMLKLVYLGDSELKPAYVTKTNRLTIDAKTGKEISEQNGKIAEEIDIREVKRGNGQRLTANSPEEAVNVLNKVFKLNLTPLKKEDNKKETGYFNASNESASVSVVDNHVVSYRDLKLTTQKAISTDKDNKLSVEQSKEKAVQLISPLLSSNVREVQIFTMMEKGSWIEFMISPSFNGIVAEEHQYQVMIDRSSGEIAAFSFRGSKHPQNIKSVADTANIITKEKAAANYLQQLPLKLMYKTVDGKPTLVYVAKKDIRETHYFDDYYVDAQTGQAIEKEWK